MDRRRLTPIRDELVVLHNTVVALKDECARGSIDDHAHVSNLLEIAEYLDQSYELLVCVAHRAANDEARTALYPGETPRR